MSRKISIEEWNQRVREMNPNAMIIDSHTENGEDIYTIHCNDCGATFDSSTMRLKVAYSHRKRNDTHRKFCPICSGNVCKTGINDVATLRKDLLKYFVDIEDAKTHSVGSGQHVLLRCPYCKKTKTMRILALSSFGFNCSYCSDSISTPNKMLRWVMAQLPVNDLKLEYVSDWTSGKKYDCYFTYQDNKYVIEIDGQQHIQDTEWSTKEVQQNNDRFKEKLAKENGCTLIRIPAYDSNLHSIKANILNSRLSILFDLNNLDWEKIFEKSLSNFNFEVCEYYNKYKNDMSRGNMAKHFNMSTRGLTLLLQKMSKLGFCEYSVEESRRNGRKFVDYSSFCRKRKEA